MTANRFTFAGLLGAHVEIWEGPTRGEDGTISRQVKVTLTVPNLYEGGTGRLTEVWNVPERATEDEVAQGILAATLRMLAHEALESLRWKGERVYDAHPETSSSTVANGPPRVVSSSLAEVTHLHPWNEMTP